MYPNVRYKNNGGDKDEELYVSFAASTSSACVSVAQHAARCSSDLHQFHQKQGVGGETNGFDLLIVGTVSLLS